VAIGVGAIVGSLAAGRVRTAAPGMVERSALGLGVAMVAAASMPGLWTMLPLLALVGVTSSVFLMGNSTVLQLFTPPGLRGRVLALRVMVLLGSTPIGGPLMGGVCELLGPRWGFGLGGAASVAGAAWHRRTLRSRLPVPAADDDVPCAMLRSHGAT
jgi:MFS family permease